MNAFLSFDYSFVYIQDCKQQLGTMKYSNSTSFFRFVNKRAIYRLGIISLAHAPVHVTDIPVVNVHVDELSSARNCVRHRKYKLPSSNQSMLQYLYSQTYQNRNNSWKQECAHPNEPQRGHVTASGSPGTCITVLHCVLLL